MSEKYQSNPVIESFTLRGVHGYKDISIQCVAPATVIAAENGTGKTTILNALNAFLTCRFHRLAALSFETLECKFFGHENIVAPRNIFGTKKETGTDALQSVASKASMSEMELLDFIQTTYAPESFDALRRHSVISQYYVNTPDDYVGVKRIFDALHSEFNADLSGEAKRMSASVRSIVSDIQVVYLPTYRRIERPMLRPSRRRDSPTFAARAMRIGDQSAYSYEGIAFGLGDVEARLTEISEEIERTSNFGYRALSARILNDMLKGKSTMPHLPVHILPDIKSLSLFLGRLGKVENNLTALFSDIESLYESRRIYEDDFDILRYFLHQLNFVIEQTKAMEQRVEQFVRVCNGYLTMSSDEKSLEFDPKTLQVVVKNTWADCSVSLDALSSGEKQIVSLMAKLYLDGGKKIVLVDEPELSLSIDWQRKVLPDVLSSGSVVQLLAITHSPFIFENELDKFATGLQVSKTKGIVK